MKFNKKVQYGMLMCLYLCRAGKASISTIALNLSLSKNFLEQVAMQLRHHGVIKSKKGPGGGYELVGNPTIHNIFEACYPIRLIDKVAIKKYVRGSAEERAFMLYAFKFSTHLSKEFSKTIKTVNNDLVVNELSLMETANEAITS